MIRARLAALALAATLATGCTTFSDNDLAARVNDAELSPSELSDQLTAAGSSADATGRYDGPQSRVQITDWIRLQVAKESGLLDRYATGDDPLPIACILAIPTEDRASAEALLPQLASPESWDEVAVAVGVDLSAQRSDPCVALGGVPPELAEPLADLPATGEPTIIETGDPVATYIVRALTLDELDLARFLTTVQSADPALIEGFVTAFNDADIYVDPQFGTFDLAQLGVAALG